MKIIADQAIPFAEQLFSELGTVTLVDGREITSATVKDADLLIVRTVTQVNEALLAGSKVKFVGSATSGIDHIDENYLRDNGIEFAYAPGSNARSVAEYVLSVLCVLADQHGFDLEKRRIGVIGCGHVGSEVLRLMEAVGLETLANDPPLKDKTGDDRYRDLEEVLQADIISLHVPLTHVGSYPTKQMVNSKFLKQLHKETILVNAARGQVVDEQALLAFMDSNHDARVAIDTWANEPAINMDLLNRVSIATPHIAGYSLDGKLRATQMVFQQSCKHAGVEYHETMVEDMLEREMAEVTITDFSSAMEALEMAVLTSYDVRSDSATLRRMLEVEGAQWASYFDDLRNHYPIRREFHAMGVNIPKGADDLQNKLTALGFHVSII